MAFMAYLTGSIEAVGFYCKAFNAESRNCFKASDKDNFYAHAEIALDGRTFMAIGEKSHNDIFGGFTNGNNMQYWLTFDDEQSISRAYGILKEKAEIHRALSPCEWSRAMADLTDKFGIRWLLST